MELTIESTETYRISRTRRFVYERPKEQEQNAKDAAEEIEPDLTLIGTEECLFIGLGDSTS